MKSQHCSAQPGRQSRTTLFKAGDPSEAQPLLHMHKPWLDTGPTPGNQSLLVPRPAECTHLLHSPHPGKMARVHTPQQGSGPPLRPWSPTELQGQHHPSSPQVPRLQAWALLETPKEMNSPRTHSQGLCTGCPCFLELLVLCPQFLPGGFWRLSAELLIPGKPHGYLPLPFPSRS